MFTLLFEPQARVLTRYGGIFSTDDISGVDAIVADFVAREGYVRNIFDFAAVDVVAVPRSALIERGRKRRRNPGQDCVIVAPQPKIYELYRDYAQRQLDIGNGKLMVVWTFVEALDVLGLSRRW
jgi:hypothetical protein